MSYDITYKRNCQHDMNSPLSVYLEGKLAGEIRPIIDGPNLCGYRYFPKGSTQGGDAFHTLHECKQSIEGGEPEEDVTITLTPAEQADLRERFEAFKATR